jgi:hypothetical protein
VNTQARAVELPNAMTSATIAIQFAILNLQFSICNGLCLKYDEALNALSARHPSRYFTIERAGFIEN